MLLPSISTVVNKKKKFNLNHIINPRRKVKSLSSNRMINLFTAAATTLTTFAFFSSNNNFIRTIHSFCFTTTTTSTNNINNNNNNDLLQRALPTRRPLFTSSSSPYYSSSSLSSTLLSLTTKTTMPQPPSPIQEDGGSFQRSSHPNLKGVFAGSGTDGLSDPRMVDTILDLLPLSSKEKLTVAAAALALAAKLNNSTSNNNNNNTTNENANENNDVNVLYVGTATYDIQKFKLKQTKCFIKRGCKVQSLDISFDNDDNDDSKDDKANNNKALIDNADIIVVGGGNTLFAVDRWSKKGLFPILTKAMKRGCILTGGSAGAICWFHSGHSDSADPDTYVTAMLQKYDDENDDAVVSCSTSYDTSSNSTKKKEWNYIRVPGLNFIPNVICCPHHDKVQSNGLLRSNDFDTMLLKLATANDFDTMLLKLATANNTTTAAAAAVQSSQSQQEAAVNNNSNSNNIIGIGIDHYAALIVDGDNYRVFSLQDKVGSIPCNNNTWNDDEEKKQDGGGDFAVSDKGIATGTPGIWIKRIVRTTDTTNDYNIGNNSNNNFTIDAQILPLEGKLKDIIHFSSSSTTDDDTIDIDDIDIDNKNELERCRIENPSS
jgi:peptidase E